MNGKEIEVLFKPTGARFASSRSFPILKASFLSAVHVGCAMTSYFAPLSGKKNWDQGEILLAVSEGPTLMVRWQAEKSASELVCEACVVGKILPMDGPLGCSMPRVEMLFDQSLH